MSISSKISFSYINGLIGYILFYFLNNQIINFARLCDIGLLKLKREKYIFCSNDISVALGVIRLNPGGGDIDFFFWATRAKRKYRMLGVLTLWATIDIKKI